MNRENKRKTFEKGYYKTHRCNDTFSCRVCDRLVFPLSLPPFPLERIEQLTDAMGGSGSLGTGGRTP